MSPLQHLRIDESRLQERLEDLARIGGRPDGGVTRLAFSPEDRTGRDWVVRHMEDIGLDISIDALGNVLGVSGSQNHGKPVVMGSHTDTVGAGGRYDGALGVVAALEAARALLASGLHMVRPIGVASFVNEEGVRYMPDMMGSLFACGRITEAEALKRPGTDNVVLADALRACEMAGHDFIDPSRWNAFLELHIEQGPVLESEDKQVGIVTGVQGLRWLEVSFTGSANHAGTTPMEMRRDALVPAGRTIAEMRALCDEIPGLRATAGRIVPEPNLINVMAGHVSLTVDLRHPDPARLDRAERRIREIVNDAASAERVAVSIERLADAPAVSFDSSVVSAIRRASVDLDLSYREMISGAGHDAQIVSRACPSAMIFVPSKNGISHNPAEFSSLGACVNGANVLLNAARLLVAGPTIHLPS